MDQMTLSSYLRQAINEYLKKKSHSLITLSDKSGIHYNTLARILKGRVEQPSMETTLGILKICESKQRIGQTLARFFPDYSIVLDSPHRGEDGVPPLGGGLSEIFSDSLCVRMIHSIAAHHGEEMEEIRKEFGESGIRALHRLIAANVVTVNDNKIEVNHGVMAELSDSCAINFLSHSLELMKSRRQDSVIHYGLGGVNEAGMHLIASYIEEAKDRIDKVLHDQNYSGTHPVYFALLNGLIDELGRTPAKWLM